MEIRTRPSEQALDPLIVGFLADSGLVSNGSIEAEPLTGGVASEIWKIRSGGRDFVVKKALARLRVAQEWNAPISRNASEVDWMIEAARVAPNAVPRILAHDSKLGVFAMSYLDPASHPNWKKELESGRADPKFAAVLGRTVAAIHSATANSRALAARFANDEVFHSIRLEPYLEATARVHRDLATKLLALSSETLAAKRALVHGDVSPKNILVGRDTPIILDAECAWYGEPAFDLAFCLNHLLLKCIWVRASADAFMACFHSLATAYLDRVDWEDPAELERRAARLLPALLLARIDGKSPVEYIVDEADKALPRRFGRRLVQSPPAALVEIRQQWMEELESDGHANR